jgi:hypothetical protein
MTAAEQLQRLRQLLQQVEQTKQEEVAAHLRRVLVTLHPNARACIPTTNDADRKPSQKR